MPRAVCVLLARARRAADSDGKAEFDKLFFRRAEPIFVGFDPIRCDGQDYVYAPLIERKQKLGSVLPKESKSILFCDHVEHDGEELFRLACANGLGVSCMSIIRCPHLRHCILPGINSW